MNKKKIIIDTDCGSDDAMAIAMALNDFNHEIILITTVSGNVRVKQATFNALTTLKMVDRYYPPVYIGENEMIKRLWYGAYDTHGKDGMSDIGLVDYSLKEDGEDGVNVLLDTIKNNDDLTLICLGPLTNIARAIQKDLDTMKKLSNIISMSTTGFEKGNMTEVAEFNVWQDPDAFDIFINSGLPITIVGWDACMGDAVLNEKDIEEIRNSGPLGKYCIDCNLDLLKLNQDRFNLNILDMADPSAIAVALYPECIDVIEDYYCEVNKNEGYHYGYVSFTKDRKANVKLVSKLKTDLYKNYLKEKIKGYQ